MAKTAVFLCIGDEILSGKIRDSNGYYVSRRFHENGIKLLRQEILPDVKSVIVERTRYWHDKADYIITSGGIGPTHDDITYESVAAAFGVGVAVHDEMIGRMKEDFDERGLELNDARKKMATVPEGSRISFVSQKKWVPLTQIQNVTILPGVPGLFERLFDEALKGMEHSIFHRALVYTKLGEGDIADTLSAAQSAHPHVAIGSYPKYGKPDHKVMVTFDGEDQAAVLALAAEIMAKIEGFQLPPDDVSKAT